MEKSTKKASKRNSRVAGLQLELWNKGFFKGVIDKRTGKQVTYDRAVDGYTGRMTDEATEKAKKVGYNVDDKLGLIKKNTKTPSLSFVVPNIKNGTNDIYSELKKMFTSNSQYIDSKNKDLQAVLDHSAQLNNNYTYTYLDRTNNEIKWIRNGKIIDSTGMVSGVNDKSDGYTQLAKDSEGRPLYDRSLNLSSTPSGVFVLSAPHNGDIYDKGSLMYHLVEAKGDNKQGKPTNVAFHHAPESRKSQISKGLKKLSFGCIYGDCDESQQKIDKYISQGDTIYSQPIEPGNYFYEENGKIKTHYTSTSPHASGEVWGQKFNLNNVRYNTGY